VSWLACSALAACADAPEITRTQTQPLSPATLEWHVPSQSPFIYVAPRSDGSVLATTADDVLSIDPAGNASVVYDGPPPPNGPRPVVSEGSDGFLLPDSGQVGVHDASGAQQATIGVALNEYARFVPSSLRTFVPKVEALDPENGRVIEGRVFDEAGNLAKAFATPDLVKSRLTANHLLWATRTEIKKTKLDGSNVWTLPLPVQKLEAAADATRWIVNRGGDTRVVEIYAETTKIGASTFDRPIYNLAIAPNGTWAAACSKTTLRTFENGKLKKSIALGSVYPVSLDVADDGAVLLGLQDTKENTSVRWYDWKGTLLWSQSFAKDRNAYRPEVRFTPNGTGFVVRDAAGLSFFSRGVP
jgi:hypothetical protein